MLKFQAHKGVSTENPENTMAAFEAAALQGYDTIELDLGITRDGRFVTIHDDTINRTALNTDGSEIGQPVRISDISYDEALAFDFGGKFSKKFRDTVIPDFAHVLKFCRVKNINIKIDNKFESFDTPARKALYDLILPYSDIAQLTCKDIPALREACEHLPHMHFHYDGPVTEDILKEISTFIPKERLTVWLPVENRNTSWVTVAFADTDTANTVKRYGRLGLWLLSSPEELKLAEKLGADIIETNGHLKPEMNPGIIADMHTHSLCSHDSQCPVEKMREYQESRGTAYIATTDHCDVFMCTYSDIKKEIVNSYNNSKAAMTSDCAGTQLLTGVELGEGLWYPEVAQEVADMLPYDVILGSVHGVKYKEFDVPYGQINFSEFSEDDIYGYLKVYFDDILSLVKTQDMDIMAHLTCLLRYVTGKHGIRVDLSVFDDVITEILETVIKKGIAMEVNTSSYHMLNDFMPGRDIIRKYRHMGGYLITLGSDAHTAENASVNFDQAIRFLKELGFPHIYYYKNRYPIPCSLK